MIDRQCNEEDSHMTTVRFIREIQPHTNYEITIEDLVPTNKPITIKSTEPEYRDAPGILIDIDWKNSKHIKSDNMVDDSNANILGDSKLHILKSDISIPLIEEQHLHYYGAQLYELGDIIQFTTLLPLFKMNIGKNYVKNYIMKYTHGVYIETHDRPHLHIPSSPNSSGYIVLGGYAGAQVKLGAFKIPYGKALYICDNIIHNDCFLVGDYYVIYSKTPDYNTLVFVDTDNKPISVVIG